MCTEKGAVCTKKGAVCKRMVHVHVHVISLVSRPNLFNRVIE